MSEKAQRTAVGALYPFVTAFITFVILVPLGTMPIMGPLRNFGQLSEDSKFLSGDHGRSRVRCLDNSIPTRVVRAC